MIRNRRHSSSSQSPCPASQSLSHSTPARSAQSFLILTVTLRCHSELVSHSRPSAQLSFGWQCRMDCASSVFEFTFHWSVPTGSFDPTATARTICVLSLHCHHGPLGPHTHHTGTANQLLANKALGRLCAAFPRRRHAGGASAAGARNRRRLSGIPRRCTCACDAAIPPSSRCRPNDDHRRFRRTGSPCVWNTRFVSGIASGAACLCPSFPITDFGWPAKVPLNASSHCYFCEPTPQRAHSHSRGTQCSAVLSALLSVLCAGRLLGVAMR